MATTKCLFAPGPWAAVLMEDHTRIYAPKIGSTEVCRLLSDKMPARTAANIRLIQHAPDLYELLDAIISATLLGDKISSRILAQAMRVVAKIDKGEG